jgi:hypothetical protein
MKALLSTFIFCTLAFSLISQKVIIKDADDHILIEINDEDTSGSITILPGPVPTSINHKLYNVQNRLYWSGTQLGTTINAGGWINEGPYIYLEDLADKVGIGTANPIGKMHILQGGMEITFGDSSSSVVSDYAVRARHDYLTVANLARKSKGPPQNPITQFFGVQGFATDPTGTLNVGVYGSAAAGEQNWAGFFEGDVLVKDRLALGTDSFENEVILDVRKENEGSNTIRPIALFRTVGDGNSAGAIRLENARGYHYNIGVTKDPSNAFAINYESNISQSSDLMRLDSTGNLGLGILIPEEKLDVAGAIKINTTTNPSPEAGTIRWNPETEDFEGYTGSEWVSLTEQNKWGATYATANQTTNSSNGSPSGGFGQSVAVSGDWAIVGAFQQGVGGQAHILKRVGEFWEEDAILSPSDGVSGDSFGESVGISGDWAVVGASRKDIGGNVDQGKIYFFKNNGSSWSEHSSFVASDGGPNDEFGESVEISGDWAIVGASGKDVGVNINQGQAYLFQYFGTSWSQKPPLIASDGYQYDRFGKSVSISGDYAIIGASDKTLGSNSVQGQAYIFRRLSGFVIWVEQAKLTGSNGAAGDRFGISVSISGERAAVGASLKTVGLNSEQGEAYVFLRNGTIWSEEAILKSSDGAAEGRFGSSVSITDSNVIVGADEYNSGGVDASGQAYIFNRSGSLWSEQSVLAGAMSVAQDYFGRSVAMSTNYAIVGAPGKDVGSNAQQGQVYFFTN